MMKTTLVGLTLLATAITACSNEANQEKQTENKSTDTAAVAAQSGTAHGEQATPIREAMTAYLQIKNALAGDNGREAAAGGNAFVSAIDKVDKSTMGAEQKQSFEETAEDAKEMAEHIGKNADKIAHQREHFEMLSQDMYDLVKTFGAGQPLYKDFCPMYNNNKGGFWLSETREIKNPYFGKKMPDCGEVKEEIRKG